MTLFVFQQRYDYGEFGRMVEQRELPKSWRGHWQFNVVDAYGALVPPQDESYTYEGLVSQLIAAAYVASLNSPPRWFADGSGRGVAARIFPKDERVRHWEREMPRVLASFSRAEDFLQGKLPEEDADAANYGFAKFLQRDARRYARLLQLLREDKAFEESFSAAYGGPPEQLVQAWAVAAQQEGRRKR